APDLALQVTRVRDDVQKHKAAASRLHRNWTAPSGPMSRTGFLRHAAPWSSVSFEMQLRLPAMFQVSVSWVEIPFIGGSIRITNASVVLRTRFTREEIFWSPVCAGHKRG